MHILLAEDESLLRRSLVMLIEVLEHTVTAVSDGEALLEALDDEDAIDLIITDHDMPLVKGLVALERIRHHKRYGAVRVIVFSANLEIQEKVHALDGLFVQKPDTSALIRAIHTFEHA